MFNILCCFCVPALSQRQLNPNHVQKSFDTVQLKRTRFFRSPRVDVFCKTPSGKKIIMKLLSEDPDNYEDAPREAIRRILSEETGKEIAKNELIDASLIKCIRMGTTVATNALLERKGEPIALLITKGFRDLLYIGNQARPNIFDLKIESPEMIYKEVVEIDERVVLCRDDCELDLEANKQNVKSGVTGEKVIVHTPLNENQLVHSLRRIKDQKINSLAIALMHSYTYPGKRSICECW